jgi:hypothetical protein
MGCGPAWYGVLDGSARRENRPAGCALGRRLSTKPIETQPARHDDPYRPDYLICDTAWP